MNMPSPKTTLIRKLTGEEAIMNIATRQSVATALLTLKQRYYPSSNEGFHVWCHEQINTVLNKLPYQDDDRKQKIKMFVDTKCKEKENGTDYVTLPQAHDYVTLLQTQIVPITFLETLGLIAAATLDSEHYEKKDTEKAGSTEKDRLSTLESELFHLTTEARCHA